MSDVEWDEFIERQSMGIRTIATNFKIAAEIDKLLREQESNGESTDELWQRNRT